MSDDTPPNGYRISRTTPESTAGLIGFGLLVLVLITLPLWDSDGSLQTPLVVILYYLALAQMWNLLAGFAGLISVGQQMFVGIGIYSLLQLAEVVGVDPFLSVLFAGVVAAAVSVPVALFAFRLEGGYFAIGSWVVAEVFRLLTTESSDLRGGDVRSLTRESLGGYSLETRTNLNYWLSLGLAVGSTLIVVFVLRSRMGLALRALRDNPAGARALGVEVTKTRLKIWILTAFWTGATGAVILLNTTSTTANSGFSVLRWTALVIFIVVIGGVGSTTGPILGVLVFWLIDKQLADAENWRFIILGAVAAVMAITAPKGLYGLLQRWRPLQFFPVRRRLVATTDGRSTG
ncbi:MAG: branched-chain amino acid ABC transporter permease [Acidimicrobiia bacterium]|nr:branched-chain amino acid ABC transporter permease [Acidimicrobiia bacterium]